MILRLLLTLFLSLLALSAAYLLALTTAAWLARQVTPRAAMPVYRKFAFLIPAYNEEKLLPECLSSLQALDYAHEFVEVLVIADNCTDRTAEIARGFGVEVAIRENAALRGKGYALEHGLGILRERSQQPDGVVILDADSSVNPGFLRVMNARLERGEKVIQAYYTVRNAQRSASETFRYVALAAIHYLRPLGRMFFGFSAGLKGNGMVFTPDILNRHAWTASLTEDIEYHMTLLLAGQRVTFAPDAQVAGEMPGSLSQSNSQVERWEMGRMEMTRRYVPVLLRSTLQALKARHVHRAAVLLDAVAEHLIPPFGILSGLTLLGLLAALVLSGLDWMGSNPGGNPWNVFNLVFAISLTASQIFYIISSLLLAKAPASAYRTLALAPIFVFWKFGHTLRALRQRGSRDWVRTARNGG